MDGSPLCDFQLLIAGTGTCRAVIAPAVVARTFECISGLVPAVAMVRALCFLRELTLLHCRGMLPAVLSMVMHACILNSVHHNVPC
jgi:hypothetical protein